ncbi:MAG: PilZ domain-containing protein [Acidobacteria bacterium]|nr:PilZ domain-containing protein [Acidobacteriota bacterium]
MITRRFSAYNLARGVLLNSRLTLADSGNQPLKLLDIVISGMGMDSSAGLWLTPLHAIPAVPRVFPFDILYLDKEYRVLDAAEMGPGIEFPAFHAEVASALILPPNTLVHTKTGVLDHLIVCVSNELEALLAAGSLPAPDAAPLVNGPEAISPCLDTSSKEPPRPELPHQGAQVFAPAPATAFEHSVLSAVAKVAETRRALEPKNAVGTHRSLHPETSPTVSPASHREVQPAIIEHHIDPEDLFSNWVVSPPPAPQTGRFPPPAPPQSSKPDVATQEQTGARVRQNGRKSAVSAKAVHEAATQSVTSAADPPPANGRSEANSEKAEKPVPSSELKAGLPAGIESQVSVSDSRPPLPPTTTFTAVPYNMWQISMPTAVAPMTGAKSPAPPRSPDTPDKKAEPGQAKPSFPTTPANLQNRPEVSSTARDATPATAQASGSVSQANVDTPPVNSAPKPAASTASPVPVLRDSKDAEAHKPGDFVASLQEKLQRARQSKAASSPPPETQPISASAGPKSAEPHSTAASIHPTKAVAPILSPSPAPVTSKAEPTTGTLRSKFKHWLNPASSPSDRRKSSRRYVPGMVAHYFTGGAPKPKDVADISMSGMYLLTDDRWMPGTMIQMTLQKPCASGEKKQSINVLSRIIRRGSDGVAVEFVMPEALSHISHDIQPSQATDKFALARFL